MRHVMTGLVVYTAVVATLALAVRLTRAWWRTQVGRHLTAMIAALALTFGAWAVSIFWLPMTPLAWALILALVAVVITWRLVLEVQAAVRRAPVMAERNGAGLAERERDALLRTHEAWDAEVVASLRDAGIPVPDPPPLRSAP